MLRPFLLPIALLACLCLAAPCSADPAAPLPRLTNLRPDILYTHKREFVQVGPMRALTLNAHVEQFAYDPLGLEIAYVGSETQGEDTVHFVKTVDVRTGHEMSRFAVTAPTDTQDTGLMLLGWSVSGKYLMLQHFSPDPNETQTALIEFLRWNLSVSPPTTHVINPQRALPPEEQSADLEGSAYCYPSPDGRWLLFTQNVHMLKENGKPVDQNAYVLYDPEHDTLKLLTLPPKVSVFSWSDNTHLKFWQGTERKQIDVLTGEISPLTTPLDYTPPAVSKQYPDLTLDVEQRTLKDEATTGSAGHIESILVWIRRSPFGSMPLGVSAAGLMPAEYNNSAATWSPTGKQVAFIANGDLCVTDLIPADGFLGNEKLAVGLKLSCADEQVLALSDLKQIGLGITQYTQDNDEKLPAADGWIKTIYPYIKSMDVFQVDGHPAVYEQPAELALAKMDSPATTEQAYIDLPCARVILFCDGHVKVFPKLGGNP